MSEKKPIIINVDNFIQIETYRYFNRFLQMAGGTINTWFNMPVPWPVNKQIVIRTNRDTLYSIAIIDISKGATITLPEAGDRYTSIQVINQDHYTNKVAYGAGKYNLTMEEFSSPYVGIVFRCLVDPNDQADIKIGNELQNKLKIEAASAKPFVVPDYDMESYKKTVGALLELAAEFPDCLGMFGSKEDVDPIRHLFGTALGWGGLPAEHAFYEMVSPHLPVGKYQITVKDVPCDSFWSITVYNKVGYMEKNDLGVYNINNINAKRNDDGSVTINFGGCGDGRVNCIPIMDGWNYIVRYYKPHKELLEGKYKFPKPKPAP